MRGAAPFLLLPGLAMSLGWGLRGYIGGGPFGAMIPGAMTALILCRLLAIDGPRSAAIAAFGAVGVGFGGEMTYGQTVGYAMNPATIWWGTLGLALKGAVWGLLGGWMLGHSLGSVESDPPKASNAPLIAVMLSAATWIGWRLVNHPKLIYFSNPVDRPREEVWFGLLLAAMAAIAWSAATGLLQPALRFALLGWLGGGLGFGLGGLIQHWGRNYSGLPRHDWWKAMEFTFGFLLGAAFGWAALHVRPAPAPSSTPKPPAIPLHMLEGLLLAAAVYFSNPWIPLRFGYVVAALAALAWAAGRPHAALQLALTTTYLAFVGDLFDDSPEHRASALRIPALLTTVAMSWAVARLFQRRDWVWPAFLLLTWTAVSVAMIRAFVLSTWGPGSWITYATFVAFALALTFGSPRQDKLTPCQPD